MWDLYSNWSRRLNRRVLSALSEANSVATQALQNIRTVKSFSMEGAENKLYSDATKIALKQGIKDSYGYAVTSAVTNYLDLGAGVLILAVGGTLILDNESNLTVGALVAFQLYWNMMNSSYQSLQNVVTGFTRAAAAAARVFTLLDLLPDIDRKEGLPLSRDDVKGELVFKNVTFFYQMRPERIVLKDLSLRIPAGSTLALVGASGTCFNCIIQILLTRITAHSRVTNTCLYYSLTS